MSLQTLNLNLSLTINIGADGKASVQVNTDQPLSVPAQAVIEAPAKPKKERATKNKVGADGIEIAPDYDDKPVELPKVTLPKEPVIATPEQKAIAEQATEIVMADDDAPIFVDTPKKDVPPPPPPVVEPVVLTPEQIEQQRIIAAGQKIFGNDPSLQNQRPPVTPPPAPVPTAPVVTPPPAPVQPEPVPMPTPMSTGSVENEANRINNLNAVSYDYTELEDLFGHND